MLSMATAVMVHLYAVHQVGLNVCNHPPWFARQPASGGFESDVSDYACLPYETFRRQARAPSDKGMHGCGPPRIVARTSVRVPVVRRRRM